MGGQFILRIEDTDRERSQDAHVQVILDGMKWLGLGHDQGPFYQMQRFDRYKAVIGEMLKAGTAYHCYCSKEDLDAMRAGQQARKEKPRYDGRCRHGKGPGVASGNKPVVRFANPDEGATVVEDVVHGAVTFQNKELDDLIIARSDGTPTYNFCVVVDDIDMGMTHVIRGDDHVNNTPRQINIFKALGKEPPVYAHLPTVLNEQGEKMSKRNGAKPVTQYAAEGYLPDAMVNYLARLGWSHGDDEIFSREQFIGWFNLDHLGKSAAQFDEAKLRWVNAQHLKAMADEKLAEAVAPFLAAQGVTGLDAVRIVRGCGLFKDRCSTLVELAGWLKLLVTGGEPSAQDIATHVTDAVRPALAKLAEALGTAEWSKAAISAAIKQVLADTGLKMPQQAMPVRVLVMGTPQTPSLDAILELMKREDVVSRLKLV
jgi:glutamyl-tRNA synthetase